ncbi:DUF192 domain-containing protein [Massilia sp. YIM B02769]|uniref:DUF192 domain-containing protein n=1 Tax=unclassified Massilia TaxID=2609279 RepID=UPI0025B6C1B4|nr:MULTISPECIES: DUF192 domain-containing protein [unclassified Massilia]MDN4060561.1 DUF192 domain-containing protein [Massilia sp. YIM B02769]
MRYLTLDLPGAGNAQLELMMATSTLERMRGLLGRAALGPRQGMLLPHCGMIHTFGMGYPIDVVYLDRRNRVLKVSPALAPRRMDGHWRARTVLELAAGSAAASGIAPGCVLALPDGRRQ